jgi:hypothetical protein
MVESDSESEEEPKMKRKFRKAWEETEEEESSERSLHCPTCSDWTPIGLFESDWTRIWQRPQPFSKFCLLGIRPQSK